MYNVLQINILLLISMIFRAGTLVLDDKLMCSSIREDYFSQTQHSLAVYCSLCRGKTSWNFFCPH